MPTIDSLPQTSRVNAADEVAVFSTANGDTRKATVEQLAGALLQAIEGAPDETIYTMSGAGGFVLAVLPTTPGGSVWAQITLTAPTPGGTLILPGIDDRAHGQEVLVTSTQVVAVLAINGSGASLSGAPAGVGPSTPFRLRYDSISNTWYRIS